MRTLAAFLVLCIVGWLGFLAWPVYTLASLARALEAGDTARVLYHVDLPALRQSLTSQVVDTYLRLTGKTVNPLLRGTVGETIADPVISRLGAPRELTEFLRTGWPTSILPDRPAGTAGLTTAQLGSAWTILSSIDYGIRRFEIELPPALPADRRLVFEFQIRQWRWQLVGVRLPEYLQVRLAETLIKTLQKR